MLVREYNVDIRAKKTYRIRLVACQGALGSLTATATPVFSENWFGVDVGEPQLDANGVQYGFAKWGRIYHRSGSRLVRYVHTPSASPPLQGTQANVQSLTAVYDPYDGNKAHIDINFGITTLQTDIPEWKTGSHTRAWKLNIKRNGSTIVEGFIRINAAVLWDPAHPDNDTDPSFALCTITSETLTL